MPASLGLTVSSKGSKFLLPTAIAAVASRSISIPSGLPDFPDIVYAITTTFTPPATCTGSRFTMMENLQYQIWRNYPNPNPLTWITDCYPSQYISSYLAAAGLKTPPAANSPFVCPLGYQTVLTTANYIACCPSSFLFAYESATSLSYRPAYNGSCYTDIGDTIVTAYNNGSVVGTIEFIATRAGAQAYALMMDGFVAQPTGSALVTNTAAVGGPPPVSHSFSSGAIAGVAIGCVVGVVIGALLFIMLGYHIARRRASAGQVPGIFRKQTYERQEIDGLEKHKQYHEMDGQGPVLELEAQGTDERHEELPRV